MPVYNAENFLEKSIESISKQTMDDLELICVDDGSTDDSLIVLNELKLNSCDDIVLIDAIEKKTSASNVG